MSNSKEITRLWSVHNWYGLSVVRVLWDQDGKSYKDKDGEVAHVELPFNPKTKYVPIPDKSQWGISVTHSRRARISFDRYYDGVFQDTFTMDPVESAEKPHKPILILCDKDFQILIARAVRKARKEPGGADIPNDDNHGEIKLVFRSEFERKEGEPLPPPQRPNSYKLATGDWPEEHRRKGRARKRRPVAANEDIFGERMREKGEEKSFVEEEEAPAAAAAELEAVVSVQGGKSDQVFPLAPGAKDIDPDSIVELVLRLGAIRVDDEEEEAPKMITLREAERRRHANNNRKRKADAAVPPPLRGAVRGGAALPLRPPSHRRSPRQKKPKGSK